MQRTSDNNRPCARMRKVGIKKNLISVTHYRITNYECGFLLVGTHHKGEILFFHSLPSQSRIVCVSTSVSFVPTELG